MIRKFFFDAKIVDATSAACIMRRNPASACVSGIVSFVYTLVTSKR